MASSRIQNWALILGAYNYTIVYKPGKSHCNADVFSRLPLPETPSATLIPGETILLLDTLHEPVFAAQIRQWMNRDPVLSAVRRMVQQGWQYNGDVDLHPFSQGKNDLSIQDGCVLWGNRVIVPQLGQAKVLVEMHQGHPGVS